MRPIPRDRGQGADRESEWAFAVYVDAATGLVRQLSRLLRAITGLVTAALLLIDVIRTFGPW